MTKKYKELALGKLSGKWGVSIGVGGLQFVIGFVTAIIASFITMTFSSGSSFLFELACSVLDVFIAVGMSVYCLKLVRNEEEFSDLFYAFKDFNLGLKFFVMNLVAGLKIMLGLLLFVVPGIIWSYEYRLINQIMYDNQDMGIFEVLAESKRLTDDRKMDLFMLDISFIGFYILGFLAFFVGVIPVAIYHEVALAEYYEGIIRTERINPEDEIIERDTDSNLY